MWSFLDGDGTILMNSFPCLIAVVTGKPSSSSARASRVSREPGTGATALLAAHVGGLLLRLVYGANFTDLSPFARSGGRTQTSRHEEETYG